MREILFRGKRVSDNKWAYGSLLKVTIDHKSAYMIFGDDFIFAGDGVRALNHAMVDPATVGQFTGLTDKNGKKVFEGDVVKQTFEKTVAISIADLWGGDEYEDLYGEDVGVVVILPSKGACIKNPVIHRAVNGETTQDGEVAKMYKNICSGRCEIIGNIHDNPELLKAE